MLQLSDEVIKLALDKTKAFNKLKNVCIDLANYC